MQLVRAISNIHVPVNKLPPEVLSRVLRYRHNEVDIVGATHVCQYWRSSLISDPSLWASLKIYHPPDVNYIPAYLEWSKSVPLDIEIYLADLEDLEVLQLLAPHISRIRSLITDGCFEDHEPFDADFLFCRPFPSLQHLSISSFRNSDLTPDMFLNQQALSLRSLKLSGLCPLFESPFPLPNLTKLHLELFSYMKSFPSRMSLLSNLYSSFPRLQEIHTLIVGEMIEDLNPDQVTSLNSLVRFRYTCTTASRFLSFLKLPRLKRLSVTSPWQPGNVDKVADLLPHNGEIHLFGTTTISYKPENCRFKHGKIEFSRKGVTIFPEAANAVPFTLEIPSVANHTRISVNHIKNMEFEDLCGITRDCSITIVCVSDNQELGKH